MIDYLLALQQLAVIYTHFFLTRYSVHSYTDKRYNLPTANGNLISLKLQIPFLNPPQTDFFCMHHDYFSQNNVVNQTIQHPKVKYCIIRKALVRLLLNIIVAVSLLWCINIINYCLFWNNNWRSH